MAGTSTQERARAQGRVRWELLAGLVRKDLKVKDQGSVLGFLWSLANPLSVLPLSAVGFALVHFGLQLIVLLIALTVSGHTDFAGPELLLAVPAIGVAVLFTVALSFLVAGLNVRYRDTQHVVEVVLMAGFWLNPIVYSVSLVRAALEPHGLYWAYFLNPMAGVVTAMQRALYARNPQLPSGGTVL